MVPVAIAGTILGEATTPSGNSTIEATRGVWVRSTSYLSIATA
jgi:hypothetical protein